MSTKRRVLLGLAATLAYGVGTYAALVWTRKPHTPASTPESYKVFEAKAGEYDKAVNLDEKLLRITRLRKQLIGRAHGETLEVAAGTGRNLEYYPIGVTLTLIDRSEGMLNEAVKKYEEKKGIKPSTRVMDAASLAFADNSFDTVVDTFGLCSVDDPVKVLQEMQRVCKPGGKILLLEHGKSYYQFISDYLDRTAAQHKHDWGCEWNKDIEAIVNKAQLTVLEKRRSLFGTNYLIVAIPNPDLKNSSLQQNSNSSRDSL